MADLHMKRQQREISPERTKIWVEPSKPRCHTRSVPVVYYLSVNGQLQHPHFMELPLSSPQGLYLKDFIARLNVLRGRGMAPMYSWSCKRSYKNGFVWHDLSENDLIYPAHGHEYILKGSELLQIHDTNSEAQPSDRVRRRNQSCSSIDFNPQEYSVNKADPTSDVSTQTEDIIRRRPRRPPQEIAEENSKGDEIEVSISAPPSESSPDTLEAIMQSEGGMVLRRDESIGEEATVNSKKIQKEGVGGKSSVLMKLISCGSITFKDCGAGHGGLGLISQYKMRVPRGRMKAEEKEKEYFSGSLALVETKKQEFPDLKRSASYNADRSIGFVR